MKKPKRIFDRENEWSALSRFANRAGSQPQLGVVSGRRRQGKTFLLDAVARESKGFYFGATQATETESLSMLALALAEFLEISAPPQFDNWDQAIRFIFSTPKLAEAPMVIDEFPYLSGVAPALPSILQREIDQSVLRGSGPSLLLCGSAMSVMGRLLSGSAPLRGRANLEIVLRPFGYQLAAKYWGIKDSKLAILTHAVVGGSPAYRQFLAGDSPENLEDFDDWLLRTVLSPLTPLFREARYLLADEIEELRGTSLYYSVLAAVAAGNNSRGGIASYIGRKATDLTHSLNVCEDLGLLYREEDVFRSARSVYRIAEPLITFYESIMRPQWGLLESGYAKAVWADSQPRFHSQVLGPHFEALCREFALTASAELFGGLPGDIGAGVVADPNRRTQIEVDVVVFGPAIPGEPRRILSLGEAKWGKSMGIRHIERLERAKQLLTERGYDTRDTVLACYSGRGFDRELLETREKKIAIIGLDQLYA